MIRLLLPDDNHAERKYAAKLLIEDFLGLQVHQEFGSYQHTVIELENGRQLVLEDHFFQKFPADKSYLSKVNLPVNLSFLKKQETPFIPESDLPVIFGTKELEISDRQIVCGVDVFASAFFMLTRWEEFVSDERDQHDRFPAGASIAWKNGFLHRPVVNELVEMLWNMLVQLGIRQERKSRTFEALVTHDVDRPQLLPDAFSFVKKAGGDVVKRHSWQELEFTLRSFIQTRTGRKKDPWDTFDYLMDVSERHNLRSHFFFMSGGRTAFDNFFDVRNSFARAVLKKIEKRGHVIGFHPSYEAHTDETQFRKELQILQSLTEQKINCGRQHFLRFEVPATWQIWEDNNLTWESSMGHAGQPGFRCGVCYPFPVFNILSRQQLALKEIPLTVMEGTYVFYLKASPDEMFEDISSLVSTVKKYQGTFVLLWHNSSFNSPEYQPYQWMYEQIMEQF